GAVRNCRDDIDMVILRVGVELNDFNCSGYINGDKMVRMLWTISMADKLVCLERAGSAILPIELFCTPPISQQCKSHPSCNHRQQRQSHKGQPVKPTLVF